MFIALQSWLRMTRKKRKALSTTIQGKIAQLCKSLLTKEAEVQDDNSNSSRGNNNNNDKVPEIVAAEIGNEIREVNEKAKTK